MVVLFIGSMWVERKARHRRELAILEMHERLTELNLGLQMEAEGFELVEVHVNQRGIDLRDNARWN